MQFSKTVFWLIFFFSISLVSALEIVSPQGKIKTTIVITADTTSVEKKAANELQKYLQKITGKLIPIQTTMPFKGNSIIVGNSVISKKLLHNISFSKLKRDEIIIQSPNAKTLVVAGDRPRGTLYAVYTLLEDYLGCRFWSPDHEQIPNKKTLSLPPINIRYASPFIFRQPHSEITSKHPEYSVKLKINGDLYSKAIATKLGGSQELAINHSLARKYIKPKKYFISHPKWFSYRKNKKKRVKRQLCLTNKEMLKTLIQEVKEELAKNPNLKCISISAEDNPLFCECENCEAFCKKHQSRSSLVVNAANQVAKAIAENYPEVTVGVLSYWLTEKPPVGLKIEPNIAIGFAILDRNHALPPSATPRHDKFLRDWSNLTNNNVYVWDYYATFGNFLLPTPNLYIIDDAMRTYRQFKVKGFFGQLPFGSLGEFIELRTYLIAKLAWNPGLNGKEIIKEYCHGHYGAAAPYILQYINLIHKAAQRQKGTWVGVYVELTSHWFTPAMLVEANKLFDKAQGAVKTQPIIARRIRGLRASLNVVNILRYNELLAKAKKYDYKIPTRKKLIDELEVVGKEFKCTCYKEWDSYSNFIKRLRKLDKQKVTAAVQMPHKQTTQIIKPDKFTGYGFQLKKRCAGKFCAFEM